jgi:hypothetical protein
MPNGKENMPPIAHVETLLHLHLQLECFCNLHPTATKNPQIAQAHFPNDLKHIMK